MDKGELLKTLEGEIHKLPEAERNKFLGRSFTNMIAVLAKRLIKYEGYSVTDTILKREITEIGKRDGEAVTKILGIKEKTPENVSKVLKAAALLLGFKLDVVKNETVVKDCPFAMVAKQYKEPLLVTICSWYCGGIAEGIVGEKFKWEGVHDIEKEIPICFFKRTAKE